MIIPDQLRRAAREFPERIGAISGDERRTIAELDERANRLANALLGLGLAPGDRVATLLQNSVRCIELDFALAKAGLVRVSLNPRLTAREAQYILSDSEAGVIVADAEFDDLLAEVLAQLAQRPRRVRITGVGDAAPNAAESIEYEAFLAQAPAGDPGIEFDPEHLYCLFYTSGTTGKPKGVMLSHRAMLHIAYNQLIELGPWEPGQKVLLMQPMSHGAGFFVLPYYMTGGCSVIMRQFDPAEVLRLSEELQIETIKLVPTMLQRILRVPGVRDVKLPHLRHIIYGASPMPVEQLREALDIFGNRFIQIYGQSEAAVTMAILPAEQHRLDNPEPQRLGSAGRAWRTVEMKVVDDSGRSCAPGEVGEVLIRAPHLMSGYWKQPELTAQVVRDGWLHTRDMGHMDTGGYVYLVGRKDEMIISGGHNIAPREIEEVLYEHQGVAEAAVVGEPDPEWGQAVVAYVVARAGGLDTDELMGFARERLGYKRPKRIYLIPELPKNANGKIQKTALRPPMSAGSPA